MFHSAWNNYLNFGSDTGLLHFASSELLNLLFSFFFFFFFSGGYRSGERTKEVLIRWAQMSTFTPLFEVFFLLSFIPFLLICLVFHLFFFLSFLLRMEEMALMVLGSLTKKQ
jgi:hypothetical protein